MVQSSRHPKISTEPWKAQAAHRGAHLYLTQYSEDPITVGWAGLVSIFTATHMTAHTLLPIGLMTCHSHLLHASPVQALKHEEDTYLLEKCNVGGWSPKCNPAEQDKSEKQVLVRDIWADAGASATGGFTPSRSTAEDCWEDRSDALHSTYITLPLMAKTQERSL